MSESTQKAHFDPRLGDEGSDNETPPPTPIIQRSPRRRVNMDRHPTFDDQEPRRYPSSAVSDSTNGDRKDESQEAAEKPPRLNLGQWILKKSPFDLNWIPANWNWSKIKPVIRSAIEAWVSVLFFIIPSIEKILGQVGGFDYILFYSVLIYPFLLGQLPYSRRCVNVHAPYLTSLTSTSH